MSNCVDCSGEDHRERVGVTGNVNPLDCNTQFMQCGNPCHSGPKNGPQCESLPSQIQNFTDQFFGTVVKTEVNGKVVWSLPCNLDIGLPNNPRVPDEGLACYFLRLFRDGIGGLTGPAGAPGKAGVNGANTYTVTLQPFAQPSVGNPLTQIVVVPNPSIIEGIGVFIQGSGSYVVTSVSPGGILFATLVSSVASPVAIVPAGSLVVPVGIGSTGAQGAPGAQGLQGPQGVPGVNGASIASTDSGVWTAFASSGALLPGINSYTVQMALSQIVFGAQTPGFAPKQAGTYLVNVVIPAWALTGAGRLYGWIRSSVSGNYPNTKQVLGPFPVNQVSPFVITSVVTTSGTAGEFVGVWVYQDSAAAFSLNYEGAQISWVRIA